ncbi:MAG: hypothetical protein OXO51_15515 [Gemmatimonadota bacterium]|nr:hypothetical protein [Gemmatimonadota bacterium]
MAQRKNRRPKYLGKVTVQFHRGDYDLTEKDVEEVRAAMKKLIIDKGLEIYRGATSTYTQRN